MGRFGVTPVEMERYKMLLLHDAEKVFAQQESGDQVCGVRCVPLFMVMMREVGVL